MSQDILINGQRIQAAQLHRNITTAVGNEAMSSIAASHANQRAQGLQNNLDDLSAQVLHLKREVNYYKNLLSQPMQVIADKNEDFKRAYEIQQELLADWMVSQKAFKELAIDLGLQLGKTKKEVISQGLSNEEKVLNNETKHGNNSEDFGFINKYAAQLKEKIKKM